MNAKIREAFENLISQTPILLAFIGGLLLGLALQWR